MKADKASGDGIKTPHMLYLESIFQKDIELLLTEGSLREVGARLGISHTTVRNWLVKLHIITAP